MKEQVNSLNDKLKDLNSEQILGYISQYFAGMSTFSSSLGQEDQVITDMILSNGLEISIFTLDTGRMFEETYKVLHQTNQKYKSNMSVYFPNKEDVEMLTSSKGLYSFYDSIEARKECCAIRKIEPLKRALKGNKIWITGLRSSQSSNRSSMPMVEWDDSNQIIKVHPLIHWNLEKVQNYLKDKGVPQNSLHAKGFISIGCSPCTRAIKEGEDIRAGRWWWEDSSKKECGLHSRK